MSQPLIRQNAFTPQEIKGYFEEERMTKPFRAYFISDAGQDHVYLFFKTMLRTQKPETMNKFSRYHTKERFDILRHLWPPPADMCEIWNAWDKKNRPDLE